MATAVMPSVPTYPVHVDAGRAPDHPSRWLWLVKWVLIIPHAFVLLLLWATFAVLGVVAFVAILITGRYPRAIFDFNVGVMRWNWRVAYYSYGALGTDRYPPFSLAEDPDFPAHLTVDCPERLSRGLVLVKWWLLVLPHYLLVAVFVGAGASAVRELAGMEWVWEGGLIALLGLIAGIALLFTGLYPRGVYDLLLGLNRWVLRVAAYAGLMTDAYPPFRLDQGGPEVLALTTDTSPRPPHHAPPPEPVDPASSWTPGRIVAVVAGALAVLLATGGIVAGVALLAWPSVLRDDGFLTSPDWQLESAGYAVVTEDLVLAGSGLDEGLGELRLRAEGLDGKVFLGVARAQDATDYLDGVSRTILGFPRSARDLSGEPPAVLPQDADIWLGSASGPGVQEVTLLPEPGTYVAVVMDADGDAGVRATVDVGATLPWVDTAAAVLLVGAVAVLAVGGAMVALAVRAASRP
ncbi:DUF4389 domain-containing protein [Georgenia sp. MJ170]|uniref:DUF4389 domain-containing protein n=1 Tax=Georgenia sunbinii TaxID=3117728 RepID=UPI002F26B95A